MCRILQKLGTFSVIFPKNWEICHFVYEILTDFNILVGENSEKLGFSTTITIFAKYLQFYMWFYKGIKVNISATAQKFIVALIYKINPIQITTIIAENTENSLNSVPHTIENIQFKNCEKFSPIVS